MKYSIRYFISIHAPPRGATGIAELACRRMAISIHAPPRGATISGSALHQDNLIFQFTPLREGRLKAFLDGDEVRLFQFTPLREGRLARRAAQSAAAHFNSRPSARGDPLLISGRIPREIFQFTPLREGRRQGISGWRLGSPISIHAPPRGATGRRRWSRTPLRYFNSRPSARGDRFARQRGQALHISIHAPPRGATRLAEDFGIRVDISIHAPPRGATGGCDYVRKPLPNFNSRPSARGDWTSQW